MDEMTEAAKEMTNKVSGTFFPKIDDKNRLSLPSKLRDVLGQTFWVTRGISGKFLSLYPQEEWAKYSSQFDALLGPDGEKMRRWLYSGSCEITQDKQGRILLPPNMRKFAELEHEVVIVGVGTKAELWSLSNWDDEEESFDPSVSPLLDGLRM